MKELAQIIEQLHLVNQEIIVKDNYINNYASIIQLFENFVKDPELIQSEIYLDLRLKYINPIQAKLTAISQLESVSIDPTPILKKQTIDRKTKQTTEISVPFSTDIYQPLKNLRKVTKILKPSAKKPIVTTNKDESVTSNVQLVIEDAEIDIIPSYIEFERNQESYYISSQLTSDVGHEIFQINGDKLELVGNLKDNKITILDINNLDQSEQIDLSSSTNLELGEPILNQTYLIVN